MACFQKGNMLTPPHLAQADLALITANSTTHSANNELVMGLGIALMVKKMYPQLPAVLGAEIIARAKTAAPFLYRDREYCEHGPPYKLLISPRWPEGKLGLFQTKTRFYWPANLALIQDATVELMLWCMAHPDKKVHLNFPGIGCGQLPRNEVLPIVSRLPDNVTIWEL